MTANRRAILLMLAFAVLWAAIEALAGHVLRRYSPYQIVWMRYAVHLALMLAVWGWREPGTLWHTRRPVFQFSRSLLMLGMPAAWITGMQLGVQSSTLMSIFWLSPLLILGLARYFLRDAVATPIWVVTGLAFAGSLLLHDPGVLAPVGLLVYPLGMALCFSAYVVMTRSLRTEATRCNLFYTALGVFLALTPFMPGIWITPLPRDMLAMAGVGVIGYFALYVLDRMAAAAPVSVSAPSAYLQIAAAAGIAFVAGTEHGLSVRRTALGLLLIGGAALYVWVFESRLSFRDAMLSRPVQ